MKNRNPEEKLEAPPDFDGPTESRGCTDMLCTLLLLATWVAMSYLGYTSIQDGDYRIVVNPLDYDGNICGTNYRGKDMKEYPYLYYVNFVGGGVCVKECPDLKQSSSSFVDEVLSDLTTDMNITTGADDDNSSGSVMTNNKNLSENDTNISSDISIDFSSYTLVTYGGIFQLEGYSELDADKIIQIADYSDSNNTVSCTADTCFPNNDPVQAFSSNQGINQGYGYAFYLLDTRPFLNRCLPTIESFQAIQNATGMSVLDVAQLDQAGFYQRFYSDCWRARAWILGLDSVWLLL